MPDEFHDTIDQRLRTVSIIIGLVVAVLVFVCVA
jgi:hypothetical protein